MAGVLGLMPVFVLDMCGQTDDDDMYFMSSKKSKTVKKVTHTSASPRDEETTIVVYSNNRRNDDEYNRRNRDVMTNEVVEDTSAIDINDEEVEYAYSRRILKFHSPNLVIINSPYYWDLVYVRGVYDYLYNPYYYDPFYWDFGWGFGCTWGPWSCWYGPIWGWHSPWRPWGTTVWYGHTWVGTVWYSHGFVGPGGVYRRPSNSYNRGTFTSNRYGDGMRSGVRTNILASSSTSRSATGAVSGRSRVDGDRTSATGRDVSQSTRGGAARTGNSRGTDGNSYARTSSSRYGTTVDGRTNINTSRISGESSRSTVSPGVSAYGTSRNATTARTTGSNRYSTTTNGNRYNTTTTNRTTTTTNRTTTTTSRSSSTYSNSSRSSSSFSGGSRSGGGFSGGGFSGGSRGGGFSGGGGGGRR